MDIGSNQYKLSSAVETAVSLVSEYVKSDEEKVKACKEIIDSISDIVRIQFFSAYNLYNDCNKSISSDFPQDMLNSTFPCVLTAYTTGDIIDEYFGVKYPELNSYCVKVWKQGIELHSKILPNLVDNSSHLSRINDYKIRISKYKQFNDESSVTSTPLIITTGKTKQPKKYGTYAIIFSFLIPIVGIVLACMSYGEPSEKKKCKIAIFIVILQFVIQIILLSNASSRM